ncbi:MAG: hypothetical protein JWP09_623 [Candidatus Taylorbacteria bacterium]|nr:hypothetical protein [Candidatus Taylorbacteria bacterium]
MKKALLFIITFAPALVLADNTTPDTANQIFTNFSVGNLMGLIPTLILIAVITFMTGVLRFLGAGDDAEKRSAGRKIMVYGIIILFVMVSIWGFVNILTQSFFGQNFGIPNYLPKLQQ